MNDTTYTHWIDQQLEPDMHILPSRMKRERNGIAVMNEAERTIKAKFPDWKEREEEYQRNLKSRDYND
jgi:hypothetical protein